MTKVWTQLEGVDVEMVGGQWTYLTETIRMQAPERRERLKTTQKMYG